MDASSIAKIVEADEFRTLTILDLMRSDLKRGMSPPLAASDFFPLLRQRLAGSDVDGAAGGSGSESARSGSRTKCSGLGYSYTRPSEEVMLAVIQLLVEYLHFAGTTDVCVPSPSPHNSIVLGVLSIVPAIVPYLIRDRVRRACGVMTAAALKKGGRSAGAYLTDLLISHGLEAEDVSCRISCHVLSRSLSKHTPLR